MVAGALVDVRSDFYQAGLVLYEMMSGRRAIHANTLDEIWEMVLKKVPTPPHFFNSECPASLENLIMNLLEKKPSDRYSSIREIMDDLAKVRAGQDVPRRRGVRKDKSSAFPAVAPAEGVSGRPDAVPSPNNLGATREPPQDLRSKTSSGARQGRDSGDSGAARVDPEVSGGEARGQPPAPRLSRPFGPHPIEDVVVRGVEQGAISTRLKIDASLLVFLTCTIVFLSLIEKLSWGLLVLWLGFVLETALTARRVYAQFTETGALKDSVTIDNRLNVPVRVDYQGPHYGKGIERVSERSRSVLELERGATLTVRREENVVPIRRATVRPELIIVLLDERQSGR